MWGSSKRSAEDALVKPCRLFFAPELQDHNLPDWCHTAAYERLDVVVHDLLSPYAILAAAQTLVCAVRSAWWVVNGASQELERLGSYCKERMSPRHLVTHCLLRSVPSGAELAICRSRCTKSQTTASFRNRPSAKGSRMGLAPSSFGELQRGRIKHQRFQAHFCTE